MKLATEALEVLAAQLDGQGVPIGVPKALELMEGLRKKPAEGGDKASVTPLPTFIKVSKPVWLGRIITATHLAAGATGEDAESSAECYREQLAGMTGRSVTVGLEELLKELLKVGGEGGAGAEAAEERGSIWAAEGAASGEDTTAAEAE